MRDLDSPSKGVFWCQTWAVFRIFGQWTVPFFQPATWIARFFCDPRPG